MTTWLISYQGERFERYGRRSFDGPRTFVAHETTNDHPVDWLAKKDAWFKANWELVTTDAHIVIAERVLGILSAIEYPERPT